MTHPNQETPQEGSLRQMSPGLVGGSRFYKTRLTGGPCDGQTALVHPGQEVVHATKRPSLNTPWPRHGCQVAPNCTFMLHLYRAKLFRKGLDRWVEYHYEGGE